MKKCPICTSAFKSELEDSVKSGVLFKDLFEKYGPILNLTFKTFENRLSTHMNKHVEKPEVQEVEYEGPKTIEALAQVLLERGFKPEMVKKAGYKDIIASQQVLIAKQQAKTQENALKLAMAKMMSGLIDEKDIPFLKEVTDGLPAPSKSLEEN